MKRKKRKQAGDSSRAVTHQSDCRGDPLGRPYRRTAVRPYERNPMGRPYWRTAVRPYNRDPTGRPYWRTAVRPYNRGPMARP